MDNRIFKVLFPLLFFCFSGYGQEQPARLDCIRVPLVDYRPYDFTIAQQGAVGRGSEIGYVEYGNKEILACFRHVVSSPVIAKSPSKFVRDITAADQAMTTGPLFSRFEPMVRTADSCFFFSFFPYRSSVFSYDVLGRYVDGKVSYMDREGREFDGIRELVDYRFGSMDRFVEAYLDFSEKALLDNYRQNGLHDFHRVDDAVDRLKRDPDFWLYSHPEDTDAAIERFLDQLQTILPIERVREKLAGEIKEQLAAAAPLSFVEVLDQNRQAGLEIYLAGCRMNPVLERNFCADDYVRLVRGLRMRRAETMSAYTYLADTFQSDILTSGSGLMDDRSILNYLERFLSER